MKIGTIKYLSFFYIIYFSLVSAQVRFELGFDAKDNILYDEKDASKKILIESIETELTQNGLFTIVDDFEKSPAGGRFLRLNGANNYIQLPASYMPNLSGKVSFTFSTWIFPNDPVTNGEIFNANDGFINGFRFYLENNILKFEIREGFKETFSSDVTIPSKRWSHIGVYCDGLDAKVSFYVNGQEIKRLPFTRVSQTPKGKEAYIGATLRSGLPNFLNADLDNLRFFTGKDSVFSSIPILAEKNSGSRNKSPKSPSTFTLYQNYPNPFNLSTKIQFELRKPGFVQLTIYDLLGNQIRTLFVGDKNSGIFDLVWDGMDNKGFVVPSGVYFSRLSVDGVIQTKKMVLVK